MARLKTLALLLAVGLLAGCASFEEKQAYYNANVEMAKAQRPLLLLRAKPGEQITLAGVEELAVYAPGGGGVAQYRDESIAAAKDAAGLIGTVAGIYFGGEAAVALVDAVGRHAGTQITGSLNGSGQSPIIYAPGNSTGDTTVTPSDRHDTTTTDRHDVTTTTEPEAQ
ncbi:hypothetical protein [Desulfarculus baarsii]